MALSWPGREGETSDDFIFFRNDQKAHNYNNFNLSQNRHFVIALKEK